MIVKEINATVYSVKYKYDDKITKAYKSYILLYMSNIVDILVIFIIL